MEETATGVDSKRTVIPEKSRNGIRETVKIRKVQEKGNLTGIDSPYVHQEHPIRPGLYSTCGSVTHATRLAAVFRGEISEVAGMF